jgi:hypothetical protein
LQSTATTLIALGWILVLLNPGVSIPTGNFWAADYVKRLFTSAHNAIAFAFLGSYFFGLQTVLHGFVRGDLRTKTYNNVSARIIMPRPTSSQQTAMTPIRRRRRPCHRLVGVRW